MTPKKTIIATAVFSFSVTTYFLWLTLATPWLGVSLAATADNSGLLIKYVDDSGPSYNILKAGITIVEIANSSDAVTLDNSLLKAEPSDTKNHSTYNRFVEKNKKLYEVLSAKTVWLKDKNNNTYPIEPAPARATSSLAFDHLVIIVFAALAVVFHVMIAILKKNMISIQVLTLSALSFCSLIIIGQTTFFRELVINPDVFTISHPMQRLSALYFAYFLAGLLLYYPNRLVSKKIIFLIFALPTLYWLNLISQSFNMPDYSYLMQFNLLFLISLLFAALQWKKARGMAIEMAQFRWLFLAMLLGAGLNIALNIFPQSLDQQPLVGITPVLFFSYIIFIGIAIGIYRYKIFNIDRWWFSIWSWFFAGLFVVGLDLAFVSLLKLETQTATIASLFIIGWIYFPLRQKILAYFSIKTDTGISNYLPQILTAITSVKSQSEIDSSLLNILKDIFSAKDTQLSEHISLQAEIKNSGLSLELPAIADDRTLVLNLAGNGERLFNGDDIATAIAIRSLIENYHATIVSRQQGASEERDRIMGDLHDELGPKLMTLIHNLKHPPMIELARDSMNTLRDIVYSIQHEHSMPLSDLLANERAGLSERASEKGKTINWNLEKSITAVPLKPDAVLHIKRVLNELMSNELRHGSAKNITISSYLHKSIANIKFCTDHSSSDISAWKNGVGLNNLSRRSKALNGSISWYSHFSNNTDNICFKLSFLSKAE
ncbi:MAG: hypothetical protein OEY11_12775 [Gammaproteobacteria bacterium]|nr:hypothetical protein [Gammaproteobacteria bacterium]